MSRIYYAMNIDTMNHMNDKTRGQYIIKIGETGNIIRRARELNRENDVLLKSWEVFDSVEYRRAVENIAHLLLVNNYYVERKGNDHYIVKNKAEVKRIEKDIDNIIKKAIALTDAVDIVSIWRQGKGAAKKPLPHMKKNSIILTDKKEVKKNEENY